MLGDEKRFADAAMGLGDAVVVLSSPGGKSFCRDSDRESHSAEGLQHCGSRRVPMRVCLRGRGRGFSEVHGKGRHDRISRGLLERKR